MKAAYDTTVIQVDAFPEPKCLQLPETGESVKDEFSDPKFVVHNTIVRHILNSSEPKVTLSAKDHILLAF